MSKINISQNLQNKALKISKICKIRRCLIFFITFAPMKEAVIDRRTLEVIFSDQKAEIDRDVMFTI